MELSSINYLTAIICGFAFGVRDIHNALQNGYVKPFKKRIFRDENPKKFKVVFWYQIAVTSFLGMGLVYHIVVRVLKHHAAQ